MLLDEISISIILKQDYITDNFLSLLVHNQKTYKHLKKSLIFAIFPNLFVLEELKKYASMMSKDISKIFEKI